MYLGAPSAHADGSGDCDKYATSYFPLASSIHRIPRRQERGRGQAAMGEVESYSKYQGTARGIWYPQALRPPASLTEPLPLAASCPLAILAHRLAELHADIVSPQKKGDSMPLRPVASFHLQTTYSRSTWLFSYSLEDERYRDCKWASRALRGRVQCPALRRPPRLGRAEVWRHQRGEVRPEHRGRHCTVSQPRTNPPPGEKAKQSARGP